MSGWSSPWKVDLGIGDVLAQANALKEGLESAMDEALGDDAADPNAKPSPSQREVSHFEEPKSSNETSENPVNDSNIATRESYSTPQSGSKLRSAKLGDRSKKKTKSSRKKALAKEKRKSSDADLSLKPVIQTEAQGSENSDFFGNFGVSTSEENKVNDEQSTSPVASVSETASNFFKNAGSVTTDLFNDFGIASKVDQENSESSDGIDIKGIATKTTSDIVSNLFGVQHEGENHEDLEGSILQQAQNAVTTATSAIGWGDDDDDDLFNEEEEGGIKADFRSESLEEKKESEKFNSPSEEDATENDVNKVEEQEQLDQDDDTEQQTREDDLSVVQEIETSQHEEAATLFESGNNAENVVEEEVVPEQAPQEREHLLLEEETIQPIQENEQDEPQAPEQALEQSGHENEVGSPESLDGIVEHVNHVDENPSEREDPNTEIGQNEKMEPVDIDSRSYHDEELPQTCEEKTAAGVITQSQNEEGRSYEDENTEMANDIFDNAQALEMGEGMDVAATVNEEMNHSGTKVTEEYSNDAQVENSEPDLLKGAEDQHENEVEVSQITDEVEESARDLDEDAPCEKDSETLKPISSIHEDVTAIPGEDGPEEEKYMIMIKELEEKHKQEKEELENMIAQREKQLEAQVVRATELSENLDNKIDENTRLHEQLKASLLSVKAGDENAKKIKELKNENKELKNQAEEAELRADSLMEEGLALAKKQGDLEGALRKLRKEKRDLEAQVKSLTETLEKEAVEKAKIEASLKEALEVKARGDKSMAQISETSVETSKKLGGLEAKLSVAVAHEAEMKSALDSAWRDLADQKKENTTITHQLNQSRSEVQQLRHQLQEQINSAQMRSDRTSTMERSVTDVRRAMSQQQKEWEITEASLQGEIEILKQRLNDQERRNEDLVESSALATAPLVRQIEGLQAVANSRQEAFETAQNALLTRAVAAENAEAAAGESRRQAEQARGELVLRVTELEAQLTGALSEKNRMESQLRLAKERGQQAEKERLLMSTQVEELRSSVDSKGKEVRATESRLRKALIVEQERHESELQDRVSEYENKIKELSNDIEKLKSTLKKNASSALEQSHAPRRSSVSSEGSAQRKLSFRQESQESILTQLNLNESNRLSVIGALPEDRSQRISADDYDEVGGSDGMASVIRIQRLQSRLTQKQGEIQSLRVQLANVERSRDTLAEEMVRLSDQSQKLKKEVEDTPALRREIAELKLKHEVLLDLFGEKAERVDELEADLEEIKAVYKSQVDSLAVQIEQQAVTNKS